MHLFVRNPDNKTLSVAISEPSMAALYQSIAAKSGLAIQDHRLLFGGKALSEDVPFDAYGLQTGSTLDLVPRLRGGAKKTRCQFMLDAAGTDRCSLAALTMIGLCDSCQRRFCSRHRLPEEHTCSGLESMRQRGFNENKERLEKESVAANSNLHNVAF